MTLLIALALVFFVMRPLLKRVLSPEAKPLALPAERRARRHRRAARHRRATCRDAHRREQADEQPPSAAVPGLDRTTPSRWARPRLQTLKTVGTLVDENPKQAALIVRDWLASAA